MYNDEATKSVMKHFVLPEPQITIAVISLHITFTLSESNRLFYALLQPLCFVLLVFLPGD